MVRAIGNSTDLGIAPTPVYTPEKATRSLPLVRRIAKDMLDLQKVMDQQRAQLAGIEKLSQTVECETHRDELRDMKASLASDQVQWNDCVAELKSLGLEADEPFTGHIDFPARLGRRPISLCWTYDEESVGHWHEVDETDSDRKVIEQSMIPALAT